MPDYYQAGLQKNYADRGVKNAQIVHGDNHKDIFLQHSAGTMRAV